jgi:uncharacterized membrane protein
VTKGDAQQGGQHGVSARRRVATAFGIGAVAGALAALWLSWELSGLVAWDVAALTYVIGIWLKVWRFDAGQTARDAGREDPTRAAADVLLLAAAVVSLLAIAFVIVRASGEQGLAKGLQVGFGAGSVLVSWALIHTVYALRYAQLYYAGEKGGADFHQGEEPRFSDFAYLAFTVGMTFQVSDTELNDAAFRANVLRHSLLSYLFGTVIVALTINLVAGLTK